MKKCTTYKSYKLLSPTIPEGSEVVDIVTTDSRLLGSVLIRYKATGEYALLNAGAISTCDQTEAAEYVAGMETRSNVRIIIAALMTAAEALPERSAQLADLAKHMRYGDAETFAPKAQALLAELIESSEDRLTDAQRATMSAAIEGYSREETETELTIHTLLFASGLSQTALAKRFGIPLRTVQNWCGGKSSAPDYVLRMMREILFTGE